MGAATSDRRAAAARPEPAPLLVRLAEHRDALLAVAGASFVAVTVLRWFVVGSGQDAALLYVVPVGLVAVAAGRRAGTVAAAAGVALFGLLALLHGSGDLDATGWIGPVLAIGLVGVVVGDLCEREREREEIAEVLAERRRALEEVNAQQRSALEASDLLLQGIAAATWLIEAGETGRALELLNGAVASGTRELAGALPTIASVAELRSVRSRTTSGPADGAAPETPGGAAQEGRPHRRRRRTGNPATS